MPKDYNPPRLIPLATWPIRAPGSGIWLSSFGGWLSWWPKARNSGIASPKDWRIILQRERKRLAHSPPGGFYHSIYQNFWVGWGRGGEELLSMWVQCVAHVGGGCFSVGHPLCPTCCVYLWVFISHQYKEMLEISIESLMKSELLI